MPARDAIAIKEKILMILRTRGPGLPVQIARETGLSPLFAAAFLSELFAEKKIKISNMKVGSSPLYYTPGDEPKLENFAHFLKSKEKDAYALLKERGFLSDRHQDPAIRVALRYIKDFAVPFKKDEEIFWRYFTIPEESFSLKREVKEIKVEKSIIEKIEEKTEEVLKEAEEIIEPPTKLEIFDEKPEKEKPSKKESKPHKKKTAKRKSSSNNKKEDKFFNRIKEHLSERKIEILDIHGIGKKELYLKVQEKNKEYLLIAYNKKRLDEKDIINAYKKAEDLGLDYKIISLGEASKKVTNILEAAKKLNSIEKIE